MIVPSRSTKTAADNLLSTLELLPKIGDQFGPCPGRCSKLAYDHGATVIGDFRRFGRSRSAGETERKESDRCIARARHVENLSRFGGDVVWRFFLLEKHHAVLTEGDKDIFCLPFFKQRFTGALQIRIQRRNSIRIATGNTCGEKSLSAVRLDHGQAAPFD